MNKYDYSVYYSRFHDDSEEHAQKMTTVFTDILRDCVPEDHAARILDIGCGFGFALRALRSLGYSQLRGLEASAEQAERCRVAGFEVDLAQNTAAWLATHAQQYDCVVLLDVIEHVPVIAQIDFLRAIHASLRPGGRLILTTPNANAILASRWRYNDYTHHSSFTEHSLFFILRNAAFGRIEIHAEKGIGRFPRRIWRRQAWPAARKWIVRWLWLQVFKAELPWENLERISFELNLKAVAFKA